MPNIKKITRGKERATKRRINVESPTIKRKVEYIEHQLQRGHNEFKYRELLNEYYTITGKEYPIRKGDTVTEVPLLHEQDETDLNGACSSKMFRGDSDACDAGTIIRQPSSEGPIVDCQEGPSDVHSGCENDIEIKKDTNEKGRQDIVEISSDEEWVEEVNENEGCCDNVTRTDRCAELRLDNSANQRIPSGTTEKRRNVTHLTYVPRLTPFANFSMEKNPNIVVNSTHTLSSPATFWKGQKEVQKANNFASEELFSERDSISVVDVQTSHVSDTDTTATRATTEFRLSTLIPMLTTRIALSTCLTVISYIKSHLTFDLDNIQDETILTQRQPLKQQQKQNFANYLFNNNIMNSRHYDDELAKSDELRRLEFTIQLKDLEVIKKTIFRQIYLKQRNTDVLTPRIVVSNNKSRLGALMFFLSNIALQNQISVNRLKQLLCNFIFNLNHKKRGLILCGPSDSGKTFLANLLYSSFKRHEIGYFNCPTGPNPSAFLLQALSNCLAYRCDEMVFEHLGVIQLMKQLLEGSSTLTTDVKYKDAMPIDPHPTLITMNSSSKFDILKWHPSEYQAFENRCTKLFLGTPLLNIFNDKELREINACGPELLYMLSFCNFL
nr:uncharacterized protein LOC105846941 isoform X2 [Hydra vulgaris]